MYKIRISNHSFGNLSQIANNGLLEDFSQCTLVARPELTGKPVFHLWRHFTGQLPWELVNFVASEGGDERDDDPKEHRAGCSDTSRGGDRGEDARYDALNDHLLREPNKGH